MATKASRANKVNRASEVENISAPNKEAVSFYDASTLEGISAEDIAKLVNSINTSNENIAQFVDEFLSISEDAATLVADIVSAPAQEFISELMSTIDLIANASDEDIAKYVNENMRGPMQMGGAIAASATSTAATGGAGVVAAPLASGFGYAIGDEITDLIIRTILHDNPEVLAEMGISVEESFKKIIPNIIKGSMFGAAAKGVVNVAGQAANATGIGKVTTGALPVLDDIPIKELAEEVVSTIIENRFGTEIDNAMRSAGDAIKNFGQSFVASPMSEHLKEAGFSDDEINRVINSVLGEEAADEATVAPNEGASATSISEDGIAAANSAPDMAESMPMNSAGKDATAHVTVSFDNMPSNATVNTNVNGTCLDLGTDIGYAVPAALR